MEELYEILNEADPSILEGISMDEFTKLQSSEDLSELYKLLNSSETGGRALTGIEEDEFISEFSLKEPKEEKSFISKLGRGLKAGIDWIDAQIFRTPAYVYDLAAWPQNKIADLTGAEGLRTSAKGVSDKLGLPENKIAEYYQRAADEADREFQEEYGKSLEQYRKDGEWGKFFESLILQVARSAPVTVALMASHGLGAGVAGTTIGGGAIFGAAETEELRKAGVDEDVAISRGFSKGLLEGFFESFGVTRLSGPILKMIKKQGKKAAAKAVDDTFKKAYGPILKKYLGVAAEEMLGEGATQYTQNLIDIESGANPDLDPMEGVIDAMYVGIGASSFWSGGPAINDIGITHSARTKLRKLEKIKKEREEDLNSNRLTDEAIIALRDDVESIQEEEFKIVKEEKERFDNLPEKDQKKIQELKKSQKEIEDQLLTDNELTDESRKVLLKKSDELRREIEDIYGVKSPIYKIEGEEVSKEDFLSTLKNIEESEDPVDIKLEVENDEVVEKRLIKLTKNEKEQSGVDAKEDTGTATVPQTETEGVETAEEETVEPVVQRDEGVAVETTEKSVEEGVGRPTDQPAVEDTDVAGESRDAQIRPQQKILKGEDVNTGKPTVLSVLKNPEKAPDRGSEFGQDVEPAGNYVTQHQGFVPQGVLEGTVEFENPLVIDITGDQLIEWKRTLSKENDNKTGKELTRELQRQGYDGIITRIDGKDIGEIIAFDNSTQTISEGEIDFGTAFEVQDVTAEKTVSNKGLWGEAGVWRFKIENAGDILRELSSRGNRPDPNYLMEKVNALRTWINKNKNKKATPIPKNITSIKEFNDTNLSFTDAVDSRDYLERFHGEVLNKIKQEYENVPTYTKEQKLAKELVLDLLNNDISSVESKLNEVEKLVEKRTSDGVLEQEILSVEKKDTQPTIVEAESVEAETFTPRKQYKSSTSAGDIDFVYNQPNKEARQEKADELNAKIEKSIKIDDIIHVLNKATEPTKGNPNKRQAKKSEVKANLGRLTDFLADITGQLNPTEVKSLNSRIAKKVKVYTKGARKNIFKDKKNRYEPLVGKLREELNELNTEIKRPGDSKAKLVEELADVMAQAHLLGVDLGFKIPSKIKATKETTVKGKPPSIKPSRKLKDKIIVESPTDYIASRLHGADGVKIKRDSFKNEADQNRLTGSIARSFITSGGTPLDLFVEKLIKQFPNISEKAAIQEVLDFMEKNAGDKGGAYLRRRIKQQGGDIEAITGKTIEQLEAEDRASVKATKVETAEVAPTKPIGEQQKLLNKFLNKFTDKEGVLDKKAAIKAYNEGIDDFNPEMLDLPEDTVAQIKAFKTTPKKKAPPKKKTVSEEQKLFNEKLKGGENIAESIESVAKETGKPIVEVAGKIDIPVPAEVSLPKDSHLEYTNEGYFLKSTAKSLPPQLAKDLGGTYDRDFGTYIFNPYLDIKKINNDIGNYLDSKEENKNFKCK